MLRVAVVLTLLLLLAGCRDSAAPNAPVKMPREQLAVAKCTTPVKDKLRTNSDLRDIVVATVPPNQMRVSGAVTDEAGVVHQWVCVVSPDATDKLRGLRIDRLSTSF